jgi:hypothetical protein
VTVDDDDLVQAIFYDLPSSSETFLSSVNGREIRPTFERLWHDCLQEESHTATRSEPTKEEHSTSLVVISWVIFLKIVGLERNILGKGNIMPQLLRMMNPLLDY